MNSETFNQLVGDLGWATIDTLRDALDGAGYWTEDFLAKVERDAKNSYIRRAIREQKDEDGNPIWHSLLTQEKDGTEQRLYKQETLFAPDDYVQVVAGYEARARHFQEQADKLKRRAIDRYGEQMRFRFGQGAA